MRYLLLMANKMLLNRRTIADQQQFLGRMGTLGLVVMGTIFMFAAVCLFARFFTVQTYMLTGIPGYNGGDQVTYAFWAALVISGFAAQAFPAKWSKKLLRVGGFWFVSICCLMPIASSLEDFAEYRLFNSDKVHRVAAEFRVINVEKGSRGSRRVELVSPDYNIKPSISIDKRAFEALLLLRFKARDDEILHTASWQGSYSTNQCASLMVERIDHYARIIVDRNLSWPDFKPCSRKTIDAEKKIAADEREAMRLRIIVPNCEDVRRSNLNLLKIRNAAIAAGIPPDTVPKDRKPPLCTLGPAYDIETGKPLPEHIHVTQWVEEGDVRLQTAKVK